MLKHRFRSGRDDFRQVLLKAMPKMLADGAQRSVKEEMRPALQHTSASTSKRDEARLLNVIEII